MYPVPTIPTLSQFSGRDEGTYTGYANSALVQATVRFTILTEIWDPSMLPGFGSNTAVSAFGQSFQSDDALLATSGILSLADSIYLEFPYQQAIASPFNAETIGSYTYTKTLLQGAGGSMSRLAPAAMELNLEKTGIVLFDLAVQMLAKRTRAGGVFHEAVYMFEEGEKRAPLGASLFLENKTGRRFILGPEDRDKFSVFPGPDINAQVFPMDPGI